MNIFIDIRDCVKSGARDMDSADIRLETGSVFTVDFSRQKTGYGEKLFFICPECGSRREKLCVLGNRLLCRECYPLPVYQSIKNVSVGSCDYIEHRMKILAKREGIILKKFPFIYLEYEKPKRKHFEKWHMAITKLQALENMRFQAIFFKKRYSLEVINSVLNANNAYLYTLDLYDMDKYIYDWEVGYREYPGKLNNTKKT